MKRRLQAEWGHLTAAWQSWEADDGPLMAAAVAYYVGLSLFPLLLVLIAGVGLVLKFTTVGQNAEQQVITTVAEHVSASVATQLLDALQNVQDRSVLSGPVGFFGMLLTALAGFANFQKAFDRIWNVRSHRNQGILAGLRRLVIERGIAFLMMFAVGLLVIVIFLLGLILSHIQAYAPDLIPQSGVLRRSVQFVITLFLNTLMLTLVYRWLPKIKVPWRDALRGGIVAAIGWEVGRQILAMFLVGTKYSSAYGVVGSFIAILLWCYYAVALVFLGAEYIKQLCINTDVDTTGPPVPEASPGVLPQQSHMK